MSESNCQPVSVSRRIGAPVERLFGLIVDSANHPALDGAAMVVEALPAVAISRVGDAFTMRMHNDEMGEYEMTNTVVEFERNRRIIWEPTLTAASREEDRTEIGVPARHTWGYAFEPIGPGATLVTETFDCSRSPEWLRKVTRCGAIWVEAMTSSLERLEALSAREPGASAAAG